MPGKPRFRCMDCDHESSFKKCEKDGHTAIVSSYGTIPEGKIGLPRP